MGWLNMGSFSLLQIFGGFLRARTAPTSAAKGLDQRPDDQPAQWFVIGARLTALFTTLRGPCPWPEASGGCPMLARENRISADKSDAAAGVLGRQSKLVHHRAELRV